MRARNPRREVPALLDGVREWRLTKIPRIVRNQMNSDGSPSALNYGHSTLWRTQPSHHAWMPRLRRSCPMACPPRRATPIGKKGTVPASSVSLILSIAPLGIVKISKFVPRHTFSLMRSSQGSSPSAVRRSERVSTGCSADFPTSMSSRSKRRLNSLTRSPSPKLSALREPPRSVPMSGAEIAPSGIA